MKALIYTVSAEAGMNLKVLKAVEAAIDTRKQVLSHKLKQRLSNDLMGRQFAIWGLAFKPNTDVMREVPSLTLIRELLAAGATLFAHDPVAKAQVKQALVVNGRNLHEPALVRGMGFEYLAIGR